MKNISQFEKKHPDYAIVNHGFTYFLLVKYPETLPKLIASYSTCEKLRVLGFISPDITQDFVEVCRAKIKDRVN